jgi:arsenate reductase
MSKHRCVLILCTGNSCRSQMAEGWINHELGDTWLACSAGTDPAEDVNPLAVRAMAEVGIDISDGIPEIVGRYLDQPWDLVITVCDSARETCPVFPGPVEQIHISFPDPADAEGSDNKRMAVFRSVRDAIREQLVGEAEQRG